MKRYLHGLTVFVRAYNMSRFKAHGAKGAARSEAVFVARCARWIATQQHRPELNPYLKLFGDAS